MTVEIKSPTTLREVCNWILDNGVNWSACARELRIDRSTIWRWVEASKADPTDPQWRFEYAGEMMSFADAILAAARLHETKSEWDNAAAARGVVSRGPGELRPRPLHLAATPPAERELSDHEAKVAAEMDAMLADDPPETVEIAETAPVVAPAPEIEPVKPARAARGDPFGDPGRRQPRHYRFEACGGYTASQSAPDTAHANAGLSRWPP